MKTKKTSFLARAAVTLLLAVLTTATAWADSWPEYITDVILVGGNSSEVATAKANNSGYTWCSTSLNDGTKGDIIYIGYKKSSNPAYINRGYITDFVVVETGSSHDPSSTFSLNGITYYLCPYAGGKIFANDRHGNLTSQVSKAKNLYLYYTKANFSDKRAVSGITITTGSSESSASKKGAINCYKTDGTTFEDEIDLNKGAGCGTYVYMHINTVTKTNRPSTDPVMASGLVYNGSAKQLIATGATLASGTMYYRVGTSGSFTSTMADVKATAAGSYTVYYYAGSNSYSDASSTHSATVSIAKSPNSGVTVSCANIVDGNAPAPQLSGTNLSTGAVTYQYSTTQNGTYTTTVPSDFGKYWVKATIAADGNCNAFTTAPVSFCILADANDLWNVRGGANGTVGHPFIISNPSQLDLLAKKVNGTDGYTANDFSGKYFELGADITYNGTTNNYTPIGTENAQENVFGGHFDGKGHTVSGINVDTYAQWYKGLFGRIGSTAEVKNVTLSDATITGYQYIGGIVGYNNGGTVENCHVLSTVTVLGTKASAVYHGGIVGSNGGTVRGCTSAATVSYQSSTYNMGYYGGIVGYNNGTIQSCLVYGGSVSGTYRVGVVVGYNSGTLTNNHYSGVMLNGSEAFLNAGVGDGSQDGTRYICAIIPYEGVTLSIPSVSATTEYPYNGLKIYPTGMSYNGQYYNYIAYPDANISGDVTFTATYSGDVPEDYALSGFGCTRIADDTDVSMKWAATDGSATCTLHTNYAAKHYIAPTFRLTVWGDGDGTQGNPYIITKVRGMNELASRVNSGEDLGGKYFELGADITYDGTENNYTPIGTSDHPFSANFDGKGYTISGINITNKNSYANPIAGIFGYAKSCTIQNITLANSTFSKTGHTGGIFSSSECVTVSNCHVTNTVTLDDMLVESFSGGIGGYAEYSTIQGCTNEATMTYRYYESGGIMGCMRGGTIKDCLYLGPKINAEWNRFILYITVNARPTMSNNYYISYGENPPYGGVFAVATTDKPEGASATATATYGSGSYTGITVFDNVLYYGGKYYWHDENLMVFEDHGTENDFYNLDLLAANDGATRNVVLNGRTLYKDGKWNTICLPFDVDMTDAAGPLYGATYRTVTDASISGTTLNITFAEKPNKSFADNTLIAGRPYIIKWDKASDYVDDDAHNIVNPVFVGVNPRNVGGSYVNGDESVWFLGTHNALADVKTQALPDFDKLLLGDDNKLHYAGDGASLGAFRAYFAVDPTKVGDGQANARLASFNIDFGDGDDNATGIIEVNATAFRAHGSDAWYTLDGRRLQGKPTKSGMYINNGKKIVIK